MAAVLGEMELAGVMVDRSMLSRLSGDFAQSVARIEDEIYGLAGRKFNIGSPQQVSANSCSASSGCPAAKRRRPASGAPAPTCWKSLRPART